MDSIERTVISVEEGVDGASITTYNDGTSSTTYSDGTTIATDLDGGQTVISPDGSVSYASESSLNSFDWGNITSLFAGCIPNAWLEKKSEARPRYPYNNITQTESGHTFEMDDTPGAERVRIQHRKETFLEMHPDGSEVHKIQGDSFEVVVGTKNVHIKGVCNVTIEGNAIVNIQGDKYEYIKGNYTQVVDGEYSITSKKSLSIESEDDVKISSNPDYGGSIRFIGGDMMFYSDISIDGELIANKITSVTRVDAGTGVSAGPLGIATLGGVAAGPGLVPVPGCVTAVMNMSAPTSITTMSLTATGFGVFVADAVNTLLHNVHVHPTPKGPSGTPLPKEMSA